MPTVTVRGQKIAYRETGAGRPPVLLVHGAGGSSLHFSEIVRQVGRKQRAVALDLPGHGRSPAFSSPPPSSELLERYRDLVADFAETLGLGRFVFLGHSMGGAVALSFALAYPERLERLFLVATGARLKVEEELLETIRRRFDELPSYFAATGYSPASDRSQVDAWATQQIQAPRPVVLADFLACDLFDVREALPRMTTPCTVVSGADDRLTPPRLQEQLAASIPSARLETLARAGHFLLFERPAHLAALVVG
jgi:pimeloyl-ACP methyl ester carboxylesterase